MQTLRAIGILSVFLTVTLIGIPWQATALRWHKPRRKTFPQRYHRFLCRLFGIRITQIGQPVEGRGVLIAANHTSYLDILILSSLTQVSFVAKAEVQSWPLFGTLAKLQETVFVDRTRRTATGEARDSIRRRILQGDTLVLFPEGTSNDGNRVLPFKSALMGAAESVIGKSASGSEEFVPVQPVSVAYVGLHGMPMGRENRPFFAWFGDMELVGHLWESLKTGPVDVVVEFHPAMTIDSAGGRKALAAEAERLVRAGQTAALSGTASRAGTEVALAKAAPGKAAAAA
jgi:1-acyl-sn-glycerol-3-phosphate acyltransferase